MNLKFKFIVFFFLFSNFVSFASLSYLNATHFVKKPPFSKRIFIPPPPKIEYFSFGYNQSLSGLLWIRLLQNIDICGQSKMKRSELKKWILEKKKDPTFYEKDLASIASLGIALDIQDAMQRGEKKDPQNFFKSYEDSLGTQDFQNQNFQNGKKSLSSSVSDATGEAPQVCLMGWVFRMLDAITKLVPDYYIAYSVGASSLSVLVEDPLGAKIIFDRGIKNFPNDWRILYRAAYHYLYELFNKEKASELLKRAGEHGAPKWVFSLASRLHSKEGELSLALIVLEDFKRNLKDEGQKKRIQKKVDALKTKILKMRESAILKKSTSF